MNNDSPIGPANRFYNSDVVQKTYDPDKAKHHLKKAGLDKLSVDLSSSDAAFAGAVDAAVLYREQAKAANIDITVLREPNDGYWSNVWMKKPFCMCYWGGRPTEDWMFSTAYSDGAKWNDAFWKHPKFNELLLAARAELDEAKRREMYGEMQQIVSYEGSTIIPMFNNFIFASTDKVSQPDKLGANWQMDGNRAALRWWFS